MANIRKILGFGLLAGLMLTVTFPGCSGDDENDASTKKDAGADSSTGGQGGAGVDVKVNCELAGQSCASHSDCCSANCDPTLQACANPVGQCKGAGDSCASPTECCTLVCSGGQCGKDLCISDSEACSSGDQCCSGNCDGTACVPLNANCKTSGNSCSGHGDCCSKVCKNGTCSAQASFCTQTGDACAKDTDCCAGVCKVASGATLGLCTNPTAPGTTGCLVAGEVCGAGAAGTPGADGGGLPTCGGECCSRACAPYGPTGVLVCQPPSGCRPTGEVCLSDADCCGSAGVPGGNGSVKCSKGAGEPVGRCDNGNACRPAGAVCKLATGSCNAENNCCAGNVNQDPSVCQQDILGIPRCTGVGDCTDAGSLAGQPCATSADCCGLPCLPNDGGGDGGSPFVCGGSTCVPSGGACTTDADCCAGLPCKAPPGSTQGVCGPPPVIPDAGYDGGPDCALYGQVCTVSADCCNGVPCTNGKCVYYQPR